MGAKRATVTLHGPGLRLGAATGSGHLVSFDDQSGGAAPRPTEVLLAALAACSAMDVVSILRKKREPFRAYRVRVEGEQREDHPKAFTEIRLVHEIEGTDVDPAAVRRAVELSASRYCAISATLASGLTRISHWYVIRGAAEHADDVGEVLVTGPYAALPRPPAAARPSV